ncbi:M48 family metallopeptidase [Clostridium aminobutyricum]|uniref:M48 family metallopeptidase n=1 Tax=Clostridium aminobutyricum TaxID=33953 RepID=A0A939IHQ5_CLOAM|nr:M48 family metallopeptidase [Clostridium aminobutyricum]MBN7771778.1 M48 family metallopeptidase [Clostridium aminobutyricum]
MNEIKKKYIKYLGGLKPLEEILDVNRLSEQEILDAVVKFYISSSKQITKERTKFYQELLKAEPKSIKIDKISNRWGSCNTKKEITYNYLICTLPMEFIDYIVVHELCHIHHMNHDRSFWRKVGSILPDYKTRMKALEGEIEMDY